MHAGAVEGREQARGVKQLRLRVLGEQRLPAHSVPHRLILLVGFQSKVAGNFLSQLTLFLFRTRQQNGAFGLMN